MRGAQPASGPENPRIFASAWASDVFQDEPEQALSLSQDGEDNDGDGFIDCEDFSCSMNDNVTVCP